MVIIRNIKCIILPAHVVGVEDRWETGPRKEDHTGDGTGVETLKYLKQLHCE